MRCLPSLLPRPVDSSAASLPAAKSTRFHLMHKKEAHIFWEAENEHLPEKQTYHKQPNNARLLYLHHTQAKHRFSARSYSIHKSISKQQLIKALATSFGGLVLFGAFLLKGHKPSNPERLKGCNCCQIRTESAIKHLYKLPWCRENKPCPC